MFMVTVLLKVGLMPSKTPWGFLYNRLEIRSKKSTNNMEVAKTIRCWIAANKEEKSLLTAQGSSAFIQLAIISIKAAQLNQQIVQQILHI